MNTWKSCECSASPDAWAVDGGPSGAALGGPCGAAPTSLERLATSEQALGVSVQSSAAHSRHRSERLHVLAALADSPDLPQRKQAARMADCCSTPAVGLTSAGAVGAVWFRCRCRLCPLCAQARAGQVTDRVMKATRDADALRFLTVTLAHSDAPLREQLDRLYACYRELRRHPSYKAHVWGGIATLEVERNAETGQWHPHLHILIDGSYWPHAQIKAAWHAVTGDSTIVHITKVPSRLKIARYVAKYASKPAKLHTWPPAAVREFAEAIHRRRMLIATGNMHNSKLDGDDEPERDRVEGQRIPLHALERRSVHGCGRAVAVLTALVQQSQAYHSSLANRTPGTRPCLATNVANAMAVAPEAFADLHALWEDDPVAFATGGDGAWLKRPKPKRPPGTGRPRDHTAAIDDWHVNDTRHV